MSKTFLAFIAYSSIEPPQLLLNPRNATCRCVIIAGLHSAVEVIGVLCFICPPVHVKDRVDVNSLVITSSNISHNSLCMLIGTK